MYSRSLYIKIRELADNPDYYKDVPNQVSSLVKVIDSQKSNIFETIVLCVENLTFNLEAYSHLIKQLFAYNPSSSTEFFSLILSRLRVTLERHRYHSFSALV